jgi:hypothetical protein
MSGKMSVQAVFVHALVFALVVHLLRRSGFAEGFFAPTVALNDSNWQPSGYTGVPLVYNAKPSDSVAKEIRDLEKEIASPSTPPTRIAKIKAQLDGTVSKLEKDVARLDDVYRSDLRKLQSAQDSLNNTVIERHRKATDGYHYFTLQSKISQIPIILQSGSLGSKSTSLGPAKYAYTNKDSPNTIQFKK